MNCTTCRYSHPGVYAEDDDISYVCKRYPPTIVFDGEDLVRIVGPEVTEHDVCGEWEIVVDITEWVEPEEVPE